MDLSIIIVNWNSTDYLRACLTSVYRHTHTISFEIIVVDNASSDSSVDRLAVDFPEIFLVKNPTNLGFAAANNIGFRHAQGSYVLFLNPDVELIEPSINTLLDEAMRRPDAGVVGCKLLNTDGSVQIASIQRLPTILNQVVDVEYLMLRWPNFPIWRMGPLFELVHTIPVEVIPGACMLLRSEVFARIGMLSEEYFMYAEDLDLNYRLKHAGFTNYYVGTTAIIHHGGRSSAQQPVANWSRLMQCRAMCRFFHKTRGPLYERLYQIAVACAALCRLSAAFTLECFRFLFRRPGSLHTVRHKWWEILKWAIRSEELTVSK